MYFQRKAEENSQTLSRNTVTFTFDEHQLIFTIQAPDHEAKITLPCPYDCKENYIKKKDLHLHLIKKHNLTKDYNVDVKYFCSDENCAYNECSGKLKWFSKRKFLNQHHNKVHKRKIFHCDKCNNNFALITDFNRHTKTCNVAYKCEICNLTYNSNERLLVHLMRHHPDLHKQYKNARKAERQSGPDSKRLKTEMEKYDYIFDSPKRSFATQTLENTIKNDVALPSWQNTPKNYSFTKTDEISTQTVFEDLLSLKSQSEDDSLFFSETVSLSDIQTQTFPFNLSRSNKETLTDPDMTKETQTCVCMSHTYDSPKPHFRLFDSISSSPIGLTSTETQTNEFRSNVSDVLLGYNCAETQTCFDDGKSL